MLDESAIPLLPPGRQVHIMTKINLSVLEGENQYLALDKKG